MCFNDLGNILGKMFRRFNLKYGEHGLSYVFRRGDGHYKTDLPVSQDMEKILGFLKLDYSHWQYGFDTLEEMFTWVVQSPYFSVAPFFDPSVVTGRRIENRTTIRKFVEWLKASHITQVYNYLENRDHYLPLIETYFQESNLTAQIDRELLREEELKAINEKFNGHIVMDITGLTGRELGSFIADFKKEFTDFAAFLQQADAADIQKAIRDFYYKK